MTFGRKTGGRAAGTPNRRTVDVIERLEALACDPIEGMARIAMDEETPIEVRARMFAELASYVAPKRKAIEHSAADGGVEEIVIRWTEGMTVRDLTTEQLCALLAAERAVLPAEVAGDTDSNC